MKYSKVGRSNLTVSKICIGTMHFGNRADEKECFRILDRGLELGVNFIDTANVYGGQNNKGRSEEIIGSWFKQDPTRRDKVVLATKVYGQMVPEALPNEEAGISAYKVEKHVADSLRRLQTDHIDLYQVHHIDRRITGEEFWGTFERLTDRGDILYMGTSNFPGWGLVKFQMLAQQRGYLGIISEQAQYNLLNRVPELEILPAAQEMGIGVIAYMPLGGGLLTGKPKAPEGSRTAQVEDEYSKKVDRDQQFKEFSQVCREIDQKEYVVATAWVLAHPAVSSAIVGIRTVEHLEGIVAAAELELDTEITDRLNKIFDINQGRILSPGPVPEAFAW